MSKSGVRPIRRCGLIAGKYGTLPVSAVWSASACNWTQHWNCIQYTVRLCPPKIKFKHCLFLIRYQWFTYVAEMTWFSRGGGGGFSLFSSSLPPPPPPPVFAPYATAVCWWDQFKESKIKNMTKKCRGFINDIKNLGYIILYSMYVMYLY